MQFLLAGEGEHARGERSAAFGTGSGIVHQAQQRGVGGHAPTQQVEAAEHGHQQVVEVVGDTAGEVAQRLHLVQLLQRLFGVHPFADVQRLGYQGHDAAVLARYRAHGEIEDAHALRHVQGHGHVLGGAGRYPPCHLSHHLGHTRCRGEPGRFPERHIGQFVEAGADAGQGRGVHVENRAVRREHRHVQVRGLQYRADVGLAAGQRRGALEHLGFQLFEEALLALAHRSGGTHPFDVGPGTVGDLGEQGQLAGAPGPRYAAVNGHQCGQPAFLDQRHADGGGDVELLEGRRVGGGQTGEVIVDDEGFAGAQLLDRQTAERGEAVVADDAHAARRRPIATDGEAVLVGLHVGVGATGQSQVFAEHARGGGQDGIGIDTARRLLGQRIEEAQALLVFTQRQVGPGTLGDIVALDEDAADVAIDIGDRLEDEIQHAVFFRCAAGALQTDVNAGTDEGLAAAVDPVEDFDEALALHFRQRIAHRLADDLALADEPAVGRVDHFEYVLGAAQHRHHSRRLLEHLLQSGLLALQFTLGQHAFGGFHDHRNHAGRLRLLVEHRRIVQVHPGAGRAAVAV